MDRKLLKQKFEKMKKAQIKFDELRCDCLKYIEDETGSDDFACVDGQENPRLYTFEQFLKKQSIEESEFK